MIDPKLAHIQELSYKIQQQKELEEAIPHVLDSASIGQDGGIELVEVRVKGLKLTLDRAIFEVEVQKARQRITQKIQTMQSELDNSIRDFKKMV